MAILDGWLQGWSVALVAYTKKSFVVLGILRFYLGGRSPELRVVCCEERCTYGWTDTHARAHTHALTHAHAHMCNPHAHTRKSR